MRLAWIGTGVMGSAMCRRLLERGYAVRVHSRTKMRADSLIAQGAVWADSPMAAAAAADVVITMVGFPDDVREVYFGPAGVLTGVRRGSVLIDMTTTAPGLAAEIARVAAAQEVVALDAPVSGGDVGARNGTLSIMVGGDRQALEQVRPLLEALGKQIVHHGGPGTGQHAKLCNQIVIAGTMIGVCESLLFGYKAGLNLERLLESIAQGAAGCWTLSHLAPRIMAGDFAPGFLVDHFVKDMGLALEEATRMRLVLPGLALVHQLYVSLQAHGQGRDGTHALILALESLAGTALPHSR